MEMRLLWKVFYHTRDLTGNIIVDKLCPSHDSRGVEIFFGRGLIDNDGMGGVQRR